MALRTKPLNVFISKHPLSSSVQHCRPFHIWRWLCDFRAEPFSYLQQVTNVNSLVDKTMQIKSVSKLDPKLRDKDCLQESDRGMGLEAVASLHQGETDRAIYSALPETTSRPSYVEENNWKKKNRDLKLEIK